MCGEGIFINSADEETPGKKKKSLFSCSSQPKSQLQNESSNLHSEHPLCVGCVALPVRQGQRQARVTPPARLYAECRGMRWRLGGSRKTGTPSTSTSGGPGKTWLCLWVTGVMPHMNTSSPKPTTIQSICLSFCLCFLTRQRDCSLDFKLCHALVQ